MCKAQAPKVLHGSRLRGIGLRVEGSAGFGIDQKTAYISSPQLVGQHETKWSTTRNQNIGFNAFGHLDLIEILAHLLVQN